MKEFNRKSWFVGMFLFMVLFVGVGVKPVYANSFTYSPYSFYQSYYPTSYGANSAISVMTIAPSSTVTFQGNKVSSFEQQGTMYIPLNVITKIKNWDYEKRTATTTEGAYVTVGKETARVNGESVPLVPESSNIMPTAVLLGGTIYVPVQFAEQLGLEVVCEQNNWNISR